MQQLSKGLQFSFGTLAVNVVGCALVGFLAELADQRSLILDETRGFLIVGILGGFTTFSAFGNETMNLLRSGELWLAGANIAGHILLSLIAVWFGYSAAALILKSSLCVENTCPLRIFIRERHGLYVTYSSWPLALASSR